MTFTEKEIRCVADAAIRRFLEELQRQEPLYEEGQVIAVRDNIKQRWSFHEYMNITPRGAGVFCKSDAYYNATKYWEHHQELDSVQRGER